MEEFDETEWRKKQMIEDLIENCISYDESYTYMEGWEAGYWRGHEAGCANGRM